MRWRDAAAGSIVARMGFHPQHLRRAGFVFGRPHDARAIDTVSAWTIVSLLKGILGLLPAGTPNAPVTLPKYRMRVPQNALGSPEDPRATDTTGNWSAVSLLKGILFKLRT